MDSLEKYIKDRREEFDSQIPSDDIWNHIQTELFEEKNKIKKLPKKSYNTFYLAAVFIGLLGFLAWIFSVMKPNIIENNNRIALTNDSSQYYTKGLEQNQIHEVKHLANTVNFKKTQLTKHVQDDTVLLAKFKTDIKKLDSNYNSLREMVKQNPNEEIVLEGMKKVLENQIFLIDKQLNILKNETPATNENKNFNI